MDKILACAKEQFGVSYLFPVQRLVIANVLDPLRETAEIQSEDSEESPHEWCQRQLVILPTGAGKSLCFQLPVFFYSGITVVVYPLISLMRDQARRMQNVGLNPLVLRGGLTPNELAALRKTLHAGERVVLITNPEALYTSPLRKDLQKLRVEHFVVDEAHCVVQWGTSFRPAYLKLREILQDCAPRITTAFTATASPSIRSGIRTHLFGGESLYMLEGNPDRPNIHYTVLFCLNAMVSLLRIMQHSLPQNSIMQRSRSGGNEKLLHHDSLTRAQKEGDNTAWHQAPYSLPDIEFPCLIFCATRREAEECAYMIRDTTGYEAVRYYHAGLTKSDKEHIEAWFFSHASGILCATCAYGMGIDKANIRTVIHVGTPSSPESYVQEVGRAGRDGNPSSAILLWNIDDLAAIPEDFWRHCFLDKSKGKSKNTSKDKIFKKNATKTGGSTRREPAKKREHQHSFFYSYVGEWRCRREKLLQSLGVNCEHCSGCDVCQEKQYSIVALSLLYYTTKLGQFSAKELVDHLLGNTREGMMHVSWAAFFGYPEKLLHNLVHRAQELKIIQARGWLFSRTMLWAPRLHELHRLQELSKS